MGERVVQQVARAMRNGYNAKLLRKIRQVAFLSDESYVARLDPAATIRLRSYEECLADKTAFGENFTVIFVNNGIYGMTGGQMAPTTLLGMKTATTPYGRDPRLNGYPYKIAEMMAHLDGATYITRQSVHTAANVRKCKKAIRKAFENSMAGNGFSLVEVVSTCNSGWKLSPVASNQWLAENMLPFYPLGDIKDVKKE